MRNPKRSQPASSPSDAPYWADLHLHTTCSDGQLTPAQLVAKAHETGVRVLAVTDHDTIAGWEPTREAAEQHGISALTGVELSVTVEGREVHLLGYGFDPEDTGLRAHLNAFLEARRERARQMVERLHDEGIALTMDEVTPSGTISPALGRPHVARALVRGGYVDNQDQAFEDYLGRGQPAFVGKPEVPAAKALALLHAAGGIGVLAHPGHWTPTATLRALVEAGLDGIEVRHPSHDDMLRSYYARLVRSYDLVPTGGSDYHGRPDRPDYSPGHWGLSKAEWMRVRDRLAGNGSSGGSSM